jgi:hypothetical protein
MALGNPPNREESRMNSIDFCFWLQGYFEISGATEISEAQTKIVKEHLNLVFKHEIDPVREKQTSTPAHVLNKVHNGNDPLMRC